MKLLKYIAVLAVLSLSGLAYAQTAPELGSDGLAVTTSLENGIVKIAIKMDVTILQPLLKTQLKRRLLKL